MENEKKPKVLFIAHDCYVPGGACLSLLNMLETLDGRIVPIVLARHYGFLTQELEKRKIQFYVYEFNIPIRNYNNLYYYLNLPRLFLWYKKIYSNDTKNILKLLKNHKFDIIHSNSSIITIGEILSKCLKIKHVWHIREFLSQDFNIKIFPSNSILKKRINKSDATISISRAISDFWIKNKKKNNFLIGDAVRSITEATYITNKEKYILYCSANLTEKKGALYTLEAFYLSGIFDNGYKLIMIGNCSQHMKYKIESIVNKYHNNNSVIIYSQKPNLKGLYSHASAFIMASECEALGRVTIEAMFYGCPVIARATGGTLDFVKDGETGYLFNTVEECASLMRKVVSQDNEAMILRAQKFVCENYSEEVYGDKIMEVYQKVLS